MPDTKEPDQATPPPAAPAADPPTTVAAPAPANPPADPPPGDPDWLPVRLDRAAKTANADMLKDLGADSADAVKAQLEELAELKKAQLSDQERATAERDELKGRADRAEVLEKSMAGYATKELSGLSEPQMAAVKAIAGEDPTKILSTIESLRPTWAAAAPPVDPPADPPPAADPPAAPPATTAHGGGPPPAVSVSPPDVKAQYDAARITNPFKAAELLTDYPDEIYGTQ